MLWRFDPGTWRHRTAQNATEIPQYDEVRAIAAGSTVYEEGCSCIGIVSTVFPQDEIC
jgi:hypothetical protein